MSMQGFKSWYQSLGVWGSLGTIIVGLLDALHIVHSDALKDDVNAWSAAAGIVVTGAITLYARLRATRQIGTPSNDLGAGSRNFTRPALILLLLMPAVLMAGGCQQIAAHFAAPTPAYVDADDATYTAIAPEYVSYVDADQSLSTAQRDRRVTTVETWRKRIDRAKAATQPTK